MVAALFDTCILIDYLNGIPEARDELQRFDDIAISIVSWIEVMTGTKPETEAPVRAFLNQFKLMPLTSVIAEASVQIRRLDRLRLPDAIIRATAETERRILVTRDEKAFGPGGPGVRIPYRL